MGEIAFRHDGEIIHWQACQREFRLARGDGQLAFVTLGDLHVGAIRQFADDLVEHVCRHGGRALLLHIRRHFLDDGDIHIGRGQVQRAFVGVEAHVGEDRNGAAAFNDGLDGAECFEQDRAFDHQFHGLFSMVARVKIDCIQL